MKAWKKTNLEKKKKNESSLSENRTAGRKLKEIAVFGKSTMTLRT